MADEEWILDGVLAPDELRFGVDTCLQPEALFGAEARFLHAVQFLLRADCRVKDLAADRNLADAARWMGAHCLRQAPSVRGLWSRHSIHWAAEAQWFAALDC